MQKNANVKKIKRALVLKGIFLETTFVCVLRTKFQVSNIILTSFRQEVILALPPPENGPLKYPLRLWLKKTIMFLDNHVRNKLTLNVVQIIILQ